jgi:hypothetical protein
MIMNLERQQKENEQLQNKFSSNLGFVSQRKDPELSREYEQAIENSLGQTPMQEDDVPEEIHIAHQEPLHQ